MISRVSWPMPTMFSGRPLSEPQQSFPCGTISSHSASAMRKRARVIHEIHVKSIFTFGNMRAR